LVETTYDETKLLAVIGGLYAIVIDNLNNNAFDFDTAVAWYVNALNFISTWFKHPSYKEEREFRLLFSRYSPADKPHDESFYETELIDRPPKGNISAKAQDTICEPEDPFLYGLLKVIFMNTHFHIGGAEITEMTMKGATISRIAHGMFRMFLGCCTGPEGRT
jgi:hypothetical protein